MAGTPYQEFLSAVESYYGAGSDQWLQIAKYGTSADDFAAIVNQLPDYNVVVSQSGKVLGYEKFNSINSTASTASNINSNLQAGAQTAVKVRTPATTGTNATTGKVEAVKNVTNSSGTQFVTKSVLPAVLAVGTGISLGKTIDATLYNAFPTFWDSVGMQSLNPATWGDITADMTGSTGEMALATAFNLLFGISPNTGNVQAYCDETAFAYMAMYMQRMGMFAEGTQASSDLNTVVPQPISVNVGNKSEYKDTRNIVLAMFTQNSAVSSFAFYSDSDLIGKNLSGVERVQVGASTSNFSGASAYVHDGKTAYYAAISGSGGIVGRVVETYFNYGIVGNPRQAITNAGAIAWTMLYGNITGGMTGVGTQDGATTPQLTNDMDVDDVLEALKTQYPDIFNNAIEYPVLQPDGTTETYRYVPVALPNATGATDTQPTGDGQNINQTTPYYNPQTMPADVWDNFWDVIQPTDYEDSQPTDETGDGDTPTIVPPTGSASALWKIYNPSQGQLDAFGAWLWSSDFVDQLLKVFNDPMQAIIGLHKVFVTPPVSGSGAIKVGYLTSTASANYVSGQYVDVDCGSVTLEEYFGNVFDYENTQVSIYLPFSGIHKLDIDDVMRGTINVIYHVDVLTGACLIDINVTRDASGGVIYSFNGNCAVQYPISSGSYVGIITGLLGIAGGVAGTIASGGALAPALMGLGASVGHMHTDVQHSGNISSNAGAMGAKKPYLIIERAQTKLPNHAVDVEGLPQNDLVTLSSVTGHVRVKKAHYDGIPCTASELEKIRGLLESGVYIT